METIQSTILEDPLHIEGSIKSGTTTREPNGFITYFVTQSHPPAMMEQLPIGTMEALA